MEYSSLLVYTTYLGYILIRWTDIQYKLLTHSIAFVFIDSEHNTHVSYFLKSERVPEWTNTGTNKQLNTHAI